MIPDQAPLIKKINDKRQSCILYPPRPHETLNLMREVVDCKNLLRYPEKILEEILKSQGGVKVERIKKIDEHLTLTPSLILFLCSGVIIYAEVRPYVPNPRRCYHYQFFGHVSRKY